MRHLKRLQTWLGYIYCAALALRQQREQNQFRIYGRAPEELPANSSAVDSSSNESEAAIPCSLESSETATSSPDSDRAQTVVAAQAEGGVLAPVPEIKVIEPAVEAKPVAAPAKRISKEPETATPPNPPGPAVSQVEPKSKAAVSPRPQQTKRNASPVPASTGKYDPGAINDQTAQRLARLLVSEIKLYYTSVTNGAGLATGNIYDILKDPIDKSRQHYRQRMGATVEAMPDYFHGELVKSLCAGDASRLGPNYPSSN